MPEANFVNSFAPFVLSLLNKTPQISAETCVAYKEQIIWRVCNVCNIKTALNLSIKFHMMTTMVQLVYEGGPSHYHHLHNQINGGTLTIKKALRVVYECDKNKVEKSLTGKQHVTAYDDNYSQNGQ